MSPATFLSLGKRIQQQAVSFYNVISGGIVLCPLPVSMPHPIPPSPTSATLAAGTESFV
jgi:hypothetical protein